MNDMIKLVRIETYLDEINQEQTTETLHEVFAKEEGIKRAEYFEGRREGITKAKMFVVRAIDYSDELHFEHDSKRYYIYRVYPTKNEMVELYGEYKNR